MTKLMLLSKYLVFKAHCVIVSIQIQHVSSKCKWVLYGDVK